MGIPSYRNPSVRLFLREAEIDPLFHSPAPLLQFTQRESQLIRNLTPFSATALPRSGGQAAREIHTWMSRMDHCIRTSPDRERNLRIAEFFGIDTGISVATTAFGFISGGGEKEIHWKNLPLEILLTVMDKFASNFISFSRSPFLLRYIGMTLWNETRVGVDALLFSVNPIADPAPFPSRHEAVPHRVEWGTRWNAYTTWASVSLSTLLGGWECLAPTAETRFMVAGLRLGNSVVRSALFYEMQQEYFNHVHVRESRGR
jgi:hypothetical protein